MISREANISIESVTKNHAQIARDAYRDFGKGSRHPAKLNFGDCFAYALAKELVNLCCSKVGISTTRTSLAKNSLAVRGYFPFCGFMASDQAGSVRS